MILTARNRHIYSLLLGPVAKKVLFEMTINAYHFYPNMEKFLNLSERTTTQHQQHKCLMMIQHRFEEREQEHLFHLLKEKKSDTLTAITVMAVWCLLAIKFP